MHGGHAGAGGGSSSVQDQGSGGWDPCGDPGPQVGEIGGEDYRGEGGGEPVGPSREGQGLDFWGSMGHLCVGWQVEKVCGGGLGINLTVLAQASCGVVLFPWIVVEIIGGLFVYLSWAIHY